jgi:hypothetical protein
MSYLDRYLNGDFEGVWSDLQSLGPSALNHSEAEAVSIETMRRVRRNCEAIVARLASLGYDFARFPHGELRRPAPVPFAPPSRETLADLAELEQEAGPLPLSLKAFWREVGAVDLIGRHLGWPDGLDPLVVDPPEGALSFIYDEGDGEGMFAALAPDDLHKDNTSGGDPYGLLLPCPAADFEFINERHGLLFVPYLRLALLRWGGFPGLESREEEFALPGELTAGLEPF